MTIEAVRAELRVKGEVQGVGFRPFVHRLARELGLAGWVRNDGAAVEIAVEGARSCVLRLIERLQGDEVPPLAQVEEVRYAFSSAKGDLQGFGIMPSCEGALDGGIVPDVAPCPQCLSELFDPGNRRYRYPFINCTQCGPRYTLIARLPYDRAHTGMAGFSLCPACAAEYLDPSGRRFHAEPNACPDCGPRLTLWAAQGRPRPLGDPLAEVASRLARGEVVAMKGVGGFHLACDARAVHAVARLRRGKARGSKPFAVMVLNVASARRYALFGEEEAQLLTSSARPIVLLRKAEGCDRALPDIAPGLAHLGVMLPCTPLHYLLFHELLGRPAGTTWLDAATDLVLVMTSANPGGEPLVKDDAEARNRLDGLAQAFLTHDRPILHRCDDSVMRLNAGAPAFVRRARGFVPRRILLPFTAPPLLACGADLKNTLCLTRGEGAFVSQHLGELASPQARRGFVEAAEHLCRLLQVRPQAVVHDLHPDFFSTQWAQEFAAREEIPALAVQHHHAHIAAVCAEYGVEEPVLGLALDGVGLGDDGGGWGGELLRVHGAESSRLGHLSHLPLPGGDRAAREPWRMAAAALHGMGRGEEIIRRFPDQPAAPTVAAMLARATRCPPTSSAGRLFDAAAALLGVCHVHSYEGEAAMQLEALALQHGAVPPLSAGWRLKADGTLDFLPLLQTLTECDHPGRGAAYFHATLIQGLSAWVKWAAAGQRLETVVLAGGCFLNGILAEGLATALRGFGLRVLLARQLPCNDGAIALGQVWVAAHALSKER